MTILDEFEKIKRELKAFKDEYYKDRFIAKEYKDKEVIFRNIMRLQQKLTTPSTCTIGDLAVMNAKLYLCTSTGVWTLVGSQT